MSDLFEILPPEQSKNIERSGRKPLFKGAFSERARWQLAKHVHERLHTVIMDGITMKIEYGEEYVNAKPFDRMTPHANYPYEALKRIYEQGEPNDGRVVISE